MEHFNKRLFFWGADSGAGVFEGGAKGLGSESWRVSWSRQLTPEQFGSDRWRHSVTQTEAKHTHTHNTVKYTHNRVKYRVKYTTE